MVKGLLGPVGQEHKGLLGSRDFKKLAELEHLGQSWETTPLSPPRPGPVLDLDSSPSPHLLPWHQ